MHLYKAFQPYHKEDMGDELQNFQSRDHFGPKMVNKRVPFLTFTAYVNSCTRDLCSTPVQQELKSANETSI